MLRYVLPLIGFCLHGCTMIIALYSFILKKPMVFSYDLTNITSLLFSLLGGWILLGYLFLFHFPSIVEDKISYKSFMFSACCFVFAVFVLSFGIYCIPRFCEWQLSSALSFFYLLMPYTLCLGALIIARILRALAGVESQ